MFVKIRNKFKMEIDVEFQEPEKAEAHFLKSDWRHDFFELDSIHDVSGMIADAFYAAPEDWCNESGAMCKELEGFGTYVCRGFRWHLKDEDAEACGAIVIGIETPLQWSN